MLGGDQGAQADRRRIGMRAVEAIVNVANGHAVMGGVQGRELGGVGFRLGPEVLGQEMAGEVDAGGCQEDIAHNSEVAHVAGMECYRGGLGLGEPGQPFSQFRNDRVVIRPADAARHLAEDDGLLRNRHACLGGVIGIVEPDGDQIADTPDAGAEPWVAANQRQRADRDLADLGETLGRKRLSRQIRNYA